MIQDKLLMFSEAVAITSTANSNVIDLTIAHDIGVGEDICIEITIDVTFTASGAGTLDITLVTDDNESLTSPTTIAAIPQLALAALVAKQEPIYLDPPPGAYERYIALTYTVGTGPMTAGKLTAGIVHDIQRSKAYARNYITA